MAEPDRPSDDRPDASGPYGTTAHARGGAVGPSPIGPGPCESCGSPHARSWATSEGPALLCPPCATLDGIGCP